MNPECLNCLVLLGLGTLVFGVIRVFEGHQIGKVWHIQHDGKHGDKSVTEALKIARASPWNRFIGDDQKPPFNPKANNVHLPK